MFRKTIIVLLVTLISFYSFAQRGKEGVKVISAANTIVNEYTTLNSDGIVGSNSINVASSSINSNNRFASALTAGDLILIIQLKGATINGTPNGIYAAPNDSTWGSVINYNNCGNYEFQQVKAVPNATTIDLDCGLQFNYTSAGNVVVVRIPRYQTLTINNGASITCDAYNGSIGGIVAIEVLGTTTINGSITSSGKGFRGGQVDNNSTFGGRAIGSNTNLEGAEKGEGIAGYQTNYNQYGGGFCRGAAANAGGGGNAHNAGGGGGGNAGNINNWNGHGNPDNSNVNWTQAWNLEFPGNAALTSAGGGKGGYSASTSDQNALAVGPGNVAWSGDNRLMMGGLGGRPLDYSSGKLFLAGGGGAGDGNDGYTGKGGDAAGLIYVLSYGNINGSGQILANGNNGQNADGVPTPLGIAGQDGSGGAGAGGTIVLNSTGNISGISCQANGGNGGSQNITKGILNFTPITQAQGPGGGGGGGYISISNGAIARTAIGGNNGTTNSPSLTEFPPDGATMGGNGSDNANITNFSIITFNDTVCIGGNANLSASLIGNFPNGTVLEWFADSAGGNPIQTGGSFSLTNLMGDSTLYVGTCPGWYRQAVSALLSNVYNASITANSQICPGDSITLSVTGGYNYSWSPAAGLNNTNTANVIAKPTSTTTYTVVITDNKGCSTSKSVTITVSGNLLVTLSNDTSICMGTSANISISGGNSYIWNNGLSNASSHTISPTNTTTYIVQASNGNGCNTADSVKITVIPLPTVFSGNDTTINLGESAFLKASGGNTYQWQPATGLTCATCPNPIANPAITTMYTVTVVNASGCSAKDSLLVTVKTNNTLFIPDVFSPNGDSQNDILYVRGNGIQELYFAIYDRWGERIFETKDQHSGWDGTFKGKELNGAVFVYYAKVTFSNGEKTTLKGDITLVK